MTESATAPEVSKGIAVYDALVHSMHESILEVYQAAMKNAGHSLEAAQAKKY